MSTTSGQSEVQKTAREAYDAVVEAADQRGHGGQTRGAGVGGAVGGMLGTFVAGPVGAMIGAGLGGLLGAIMGADHDQRGGA